LPLVLEEAPVFKRARGALRKSPCSPIRLRFVRPRLEELEARTLLSGSAVPDTLSATQPVSPPAAQGSTPASSVVVQPDIVVLSPSVSPNVTGYTPAQIRQAYGINQTVLPNGQPATGAGQTIAIVDAYNDPNISSDLATFDSQFGLSAPPSFQVVPLNNVSQVNNGWAAETSLDVEWAHAVAPGANILLVEAPSNSLADLLSAVSYAAGQPGVVAVSMSWGANEFNGETSFDNVFTTPPNHPGVTFVASSGDGGSAPGPQFPSVSPNVLAVGGTSLYLNTSGGYGSETAWNLSGGGKSLYEAEPSFQQGAQNFGVRTTPDVSYDSNPNTGFIIYDSVGLNGQTGFIVGGTSAGAPQWAAILALADQARAAVGLGSLANGQAAVYGLPASDFHDITSGSNGAYSAGPGYDLVTGIGSPQVNLIVPSLAGISPPPGSGGGSSTSSTSSTSSSSTSNSGTFNSSQVAFDAFAVAEGLASGDVFLALYGFSDYQKLIQSLSGPAQGQAQSQFSEALSVDFLFLSGTP
jgi:subtilase family serine protease